MDGKIEKLTIGYCATLKSRFSEEEEAQDTKAGKSWHEIPLESLCSISYLRYPRPQDELDREHQEDMDFLRALRHKRSHKFSSFNALSADQETRRQKFDFVVDRMDDPMGDVGTVLVLTRPTVK